MDLNLKIAFFFVFILGFTPIYQISADSFDKTDALINKNKVLGDLKSFNFYDLNFNNIDNFGNYKSDKLKGNKSIWIIFQPDCQSCRSQFKDLSCLPGDISKVAVGINGNREKLLKELKLSNFNGLKLQSYLKFEKILDIKGTPTLLFIDEMGLLGFKSLAVKKCNEILEQFEYLNQGRI